MPTPAEPGATTAPDAVPPSSTSVLEEQARAVARARASRDLLKAQHDRAYAAFLDTHRELLAGLKDTALKCAQLEDVLRDTGARVFRETGVKHLLLGVSVREEVALQYDDAAALAWAKEHGMCIQLDRAGFDAVARKNPLPFVKRDVVPRVTLAKDMTSYLGVLHVVADPAVPPGEIRMLQGSGADAREVGRVINVDPQ